jgi:hypothetical protein
MRKIASPAAWALAGTLTAAAAQAASAQTMNVQSLMSDGYTVAGVTQPPSGGASVFLQKGTTLVFCFIAETPDSPTVATRYCKPVK